ncbi:MAG TPA: DUF2877 domain-containing protein [Promineifilum sp.]|nr:DUF2877 domain-containing protein [Promineifilum sp.]
MNAQQVAPRARGWLRKSHSARVHYLFKEVCILANESDEVIALVSPNVGPNPFAVVLAGNFTAGLAIQQPVGLDNWKQTLTVGSLSVVWRQAAVWQPRPDWSQLRGADTGQWPSVAGLPADISHSLKLVVDGIVGDDSAIYRAGVAGLAGRGGGLTPTGDDVLIGVLHGLWVWYPRHLRRPRQEWMRMLLATAVPRTTILSANFLCAAAAGEATWQWHDLVKGHAHAAESILAIGHSSGADAWAGFLYTGSVLKSL